MSSITTRNLIIASCILVATVGLFIFLLIASSNQYQLLITQLEAMEKWKAQEASHLQVKRLAQESTDERKQLSQSFLGKESDSIDFLNSVEVLAANNTIELETNSLRVAESQEGTRDSLLAAFSLQGSRDDVQRFIEVLEQLPYLAEITNFRLWSSPGQQLWSADVTVKINVYEYAE